jgi:4,5-dihydroxyphthalate decarboxylase
MRVRKRSEIDMMVLGGDYAHTRWMSEQTSPFQGLVYQARPLKELYKVILSGGEFEVSEFSLSNYIMMREQPGCPLIAIPVFPSRAFRHSAMFVRNESQLRSFEQLSGKRIGITEYTMTAAVWLRGIMSDHYNMHWRDVAWISQPEKRFPPPPEAHVVETDDDLEELLLRGEIDALVKPRPRESESPIGQRKLRNILDDVDDVERRYFCDTGIFPIMHTVVIHKAVLANHPSSPKAVLEFYERSKESAGRLNPNDDDKPYGLGLPNQKTIKTLCRYLFEQNLIRQPINDISTLFI